MTKLDEILRLAEEADPVFPYPRVHYQDIKQMVELIRMQHEALERVGRDQYPVIEEAIAAFEKFEKGEG